MHQHVRRFYTNANNAGEQSDHRVWSITGRLLHTRQASLLDLADMITEEPPALYSILTAIVTRPIASRTKYQLRSVALGLL